MSAWIKPEITNSFRIFSIAGEADTDGAQYIFTLTGGGDPSKLALILYDTHTGNNIGIRTTTLLSANVWTHVCATYSGNRSHSSMALYLNGNPASITTTSAGSFNRLRSTTNPIRLGEFFNNDSRSLGQGAWDQMKIWGVALTPEQVLAEYNRCQGGTCS
jgi:hypothetical protein